MKRRCYSESRKSMEESTNGFIKRAVEEAIARDDKKIALTEYAQLTQNREM